jgi:HK97 family phage prohead protease
MPLKYTSAPVLNDPSLGERQILVVASDPTLDRTKDVMRPEGVMLDNYNQNPIVLASHDPTQPIGTAKAAINNGRVEALIDFAPAGISAKADEYCGLAKAGVLRAVSVGFDPIEFAPNKAGGYDYTKWELMELSLVAVPANPGARIIARSHQPNDEKASDWKVGASRNLPVGGDEAWDGAAAKASIFDQAGFDGDSPDTGYARKGFLAYDASAPNLKGSYKLPFAKVVNGRLTAMPSGVRAAASRLPGTDIPSAVKDKAQAVLDHYKAKMDIGQDGDGKSVRRRVKDLYAMAMLAQVLDNLGCVHMMAQCEAEVEQDGSKLPAMLAEGMRQLGDTLIAMSQEEVTELLAQHGAIDTPPTIAAAGAIRLKLWRAATAKAGRALSAANEEHVAAIVKALDGLATGHVKVADLHDELKEILAELQDHGARADTHIKALRDAARKPNGNGEGEDEGGDDGNNGRNGKKPKLNGDQEEADEDQELSFDPARRKRFLQMRASEPV